MSFLFNKLVISVRDENQKVLKNQKWGEIIGETPAHVKILRQTKHVNADDFADIVNDLIAYLKDEDQFLIINSSSLEK